MRSEIPTIRVDAPRVSAHMAIALVVHHLSLAAMYHEATPSDTALLLKAASEVMDEPALGAARVWITELEQFYADLYK